MAFFLLCTTWHDFCLYKSRGQGGDEMVEITASQLIRKENVILGRDYDDFESMILSVSELLIHDGFVYESYPNAVIAREKIYPTGLKTICMQVGIPHTDREHVKQSVVTIIRPLNPICFKEMGLGVDNVDAEMIFLLAIKESKAQMSVLSKLMGVFCDESVLMSLKNAHSEDEIVEILENVLR